MQVVKYVFQPHGDERGQLVVFEEHRDIPFHIKRVYFMYETAEGIARGKYAHKKLEQILVCIHGSCKIKLDNGREKKVVPLEKPYEGLYVTSGMWCEMFDFSPGAVLMCFASEFYDENDYIRDYEEFLNFVNNKKEVNYAPVSHKKIISQDFVEKISEYKEIYLFNSSGDVDGKLISFEERKDIPFSIKRVFFMYDTLNGKIVRGKHAHRDIEQILVCIHGSCKIRFDDGHEKKVYTLDKPSEGLYMPKHLWGEQFDFSDDAVLLVFASDHYDESDYIRDYDEFLKFIQEKENEN